MLFRSKIKPVLDTVATLSDNKNLIDGVKVYFGDSSWVLARPSGTEPLLRIYFESDTEENLKKLEKDIMSKIDDII